MSIQSSRVGRLIAWIAGHSSLPLIRRSESHPKSYQEANERDQAENAHVEEAVNFHEKPSVYEIEVWNLSMVD